MKEKSVERIPASKLLEENVKSLININTNGYSSQAQLAKAIGISPASLTHALKSNPNLNTIQKIADALGVSVASLFKERKAVEGYAIIKGDKKVVFTNIEELEKVFAEAKETEIPKFTFKL